MTAYEFGAMLPSIVLLFVLLGALVWYRRSREKQPLSPWRGEVYGVGGWLALFVYGSFVMVPLFHIGKTARVFTDAQMANPMLASVPGFRAYQIFSWVLIAAIVLSQFWVSNRLRTRFEPSSARIAKYYMALSPLVVYGLDVAAAWFMLHVNGVGEEMGETVRSIFVGLIWGWYFRDSTRVYNTYLRPRSGREGVTTRTTLERREPSLDSEPAVSGGNAGNAAS